MINKLSIFFNPILTLLNRLWSKKKAAFQIYNSNGKKVKYKKLLKHVQTQDVVLFGEFHNNPISHWLQLELSKDLHQNQTIDIGSRND